MILLNPSIFGTASPKFTKDGTDVLLDYVTISRDEPEDLSLVDTSVITGHRTYTDKGEHWVFELMLNLFKYPDPRAKFNELWAYRKAVVDRLYRRRDSNPFKNASGTDVKFKLVQIIPLHLTHPLQPDTLQLRFESIDYVDISKSVEATIVDGAGDSLLDGHDNELNLSTFI